MTPDAGGRLGAARLRRLLVPSLPWALALAVFLVCAATPFASALISADGDVALHVTLGRVMLAQGGLLATEPTSVAAPSTPFIAHEWLAQLLLGASHEACGLAGPVLLAAGLLAALFGLVLAWARREGAGPWAAVAIIALTVLVARLHMLARPHLLTWALAALWTWRLELLRQGRLGARRWLLESLAVLLVWVDLHGGFLVAFYLLGLEGLGTLARALRSRGEARGRAVLRCGQLVVASALLLLATGLNPFGFTLHAHLLRHLADPGLSFQREFLPPDLTRPEQWPIAVWAGVALLSLGLGRRRPAPEEWALVLGLLLISARSARHAPLAAVLTAPLLARRLQLLLEQLGEDGWGAARALLASSQRLAALERGHGGALSVGALALGVAWSVGWRDTPPVRFDPERLPVEAATWIREHPHASAGPVFASYHWGGYVAYALYPAHRTFINGFADHFGHDPLRTYALVHEAQPGWAEALDRYAIGWVLEEPGAPLCRALAADAGWRQAHQDAQAVVFVRAGERIAPAGARR